VFFLLDLVSKSLNLGFMQVFELILILLINSDQIVLIVLKFSLDQKDFLLLLLLQLLELVL